MGANEKYEAAMHGHTPNVNHRHVYTPSIRGLHAASTMGGVHQITSSEFNRGIDAIRADAKREALEEAADGLERGIPLAKSTQEWLRDQAARDWLRERANKGQS